MLIFLAVNNDIVFIFIFFIGHFSYAHIRKGMTSSPGLSHSPLFEPMFFTPSTRGHFGQHSLQSMRTSRFAEVEAQRGQSGGNPGMSRTGDTETGAQGLFFPDLNHSTQDSGQGVIVSILRFAEGSGPFDLLADDEIGFHFSLSLNRNDTSILNAKSFVFQDLR